MSYRYTQTLADGANDLGVHLFTKVSAAVGTAIEEAVKVFRDRRQRSARWAYLPSVSTAVLMPVEPDAPPPLLIPEGTSIPGISTTVPVLSESAAKSISGAWTPTIQEISSLSLESLMITMQGFGDYLADGLDDALVDALEAESFATAQRVASALSTSSLATAMQKHTALRTAGGGLGPPPVTLLCAPDVAVVYANLFPQGVERLSVEVCRLLPAGRWYLMPPAARSPLAFPIAERPSIDDKGMTADSTMNWTVRFYVMTAGSPHVYRAADNSPRWTIQGGT